MDLFNVTSSAGMEYLYGYLNQGDGDERANRDVSLPAQIVVYQQNQHGRIPRSYQPALYLRSTC